MTEVAMRTSDNKTNGMDDRGSWAVGGTTMIGIGVGFIFLYVSPMLLVASVMIGVGSGLLIAAAISDK